jgi:hypothetical protein
MTSDEVYKLIEANGLTLHGDIEHFAALVASAEREACAKVCDDASEPDGADLAERIRARGQA